MDRWPLPCLSPSLSTCRNGLRWGSTLSTSLPCTKYRLLEIMVGRMALKLAAFSKRKIPVLLLLNFTLQLCSRLTCLENGFIRRQNCPIFWTNLVLFDFLLQCGWVICMNVVFSSKFKNRVVQIWFSLKVKVHPGTARVSFSLDRGRSDPVSTNTVGLTTFWVTITFPPDSMRGMKMNQTDKCFHHPNHPTPLVCPVQDPLLVRRRLQRGREGDRGKQPLSPLWSHTGIICEFIIFKQQDLEWLVQLLINWYETNIVMGRFRV